jgi:hypothetical protein
MAPENPKFLGLQTLKGSAPIRFPQQISDYTATCPITLMTEVTGFTE